MKSNPTPPEETPVATKGRTAKRRRRGAPPLSVAFVTKLQRTLGNREMQRALRIGDGAPRAARRTGAPPEVTRAELAKLEPSRRTRGVALILMLVTLLALTALTAGALWRGSWSL
jgi:hypothetical protein